MSARFQRFTCAAAALSVLSVLAGLKVGDATGEQMTTFANAFLESLDSDQKATATMPFDSEKRVDWHFIPKDERKGLVMREMNSAQQAAALRLVRSALSEAGYDKTRQIMMLEAVLRQMEGDSRRWARDPQKYYVTLFGEPSDEGRWGLSFEGHHLSLNFVIEDGKVVDSTPQFLAANPATIMNEVEGPLSKGTRVLRKEEALAFELVNALSKQQQDKAFIAEEAPAEIRFAGEPQVNVGQPEGITFSDLNKKQQDLLKQLISAYVDVVADPVASRRHEQIKENGWDDIHFAWAGATEPNIGHYYRIRGQEFLIEFVNTQPDPMGNPANHIHCVWRDLTGDFDLPIQ